MTVRGGEFMKQISLTTTNGLRVEGKVHKEVIRAISTGERDPNRRLVIEKATIYSERSGAQEYDEANVYMGEVVTWTVTT